MPDLRKAAFAALVAFAEKRRSVRVDCIAPVTVEEFNCDVDVISSGAMS